VRRTRPLLVAFGFALPAVAPASAQVTREWGLQLTGATGTPAFLGAGAVWAWRPGVRDRLLVHGALGAAEDQAAFRFEATWHLMLSPRTERGIGAYIGGGLAGQFAETSHGWLILTGGIEQNPGAKRGWVLELGLGGGVRMTVGYRWRR